MIVRQRPFSVRNTKLKIFIFLQLLLDTIESIAERKVIFAAVGEKRTKMSNQWQNIDRWQSANEQSSIIKLIEEMLAKESHWRERDAPDEVDRLPSTVVLLLVKW